MRREEVTLANILKISVLWKLPDNFSKQAKYNSLKVDWEIAKSWHSTTFFSIFFSFQLNSSRASALNKMAFEASSDIELLVFMNIQMPRLHSLSLQWMFLSFGFCSFDKLI